MALKKPFNMTIPTNIYNTELRLPSLMRVRARLVILFQTDVFPGDLIPVNRHV